MLSFQNAKWCSNILLSHRPALLNAFKLSINRKWLCKSSDDGHQSESEIWLRATSDVENGNVSAFEDEYGNQLRPTGQLTNAFPLQPVKRRAMLTKISNFVDWRRIKIKAGNGGNGMISFLRLFANDRAGPDGGDGGHGGHIIFQAHRQTKSLSHVQSLYQGHAGENGGSRDLTGRSGQHIYIPVPVGTLIKMEVPLKMKPFSESEINQIDNEPQLSDSCDIVRNHEQNDSKLYDNKYQMIADLKQDGDLFVAARGGAGGKGNHFFLSNENRQPRVCERGGEGEQKVYVLEMKTIAHIGLVGFPNAGKSTLLRSVSRARPKVAAYPFTTLQPAIGIVNYDDETQLVLADLPGLIKGAHRNYGLGHSFLRHLERCICLVYVLDLSQIDVVEQFDTLKNELELFKVGLSKRPHAIVGNKIDLPEAEVQLQRLKQHIRDNTPENEIPIPIIAISAKFGTNLTEYLKHIRGLYDLYNDPEEDEPGFRW